MRPANHSPQTALPPIRRAPVEDVSAPATLPVATWAPLTYMRCTAASNVNATWVHAPVASAAGPTSSRSPAATWT